MEEHQRFLDTVLALIQKRLEKLTRQITEGEKEVEAMHEYYWENYTREFDSFIFQKNLTGLIKPAFFMSNLSFYSIAFYCNV